MEKHTASGSRDSTALGSAAVAPGLSAKAARILYLTHSSVPLIRRRQRGGNSTRGISWNVPTALPNTKNEKTYPVRGHCSQLGWHRFHCSQRKPIKGLTILDDSWNTIAAVIISSGACGLQVRIKRRPHPDAWFCVFLAPVTSALIEINGVRSLENTHCVVTSFSPSCLSAQPQYPHFHLCANAKQACSCQCLFLFHRHFQEVFQAHVFVPSRALIGSVMVQGRGQGQG